MILNPPDLHMMGDVHRGKKYSRFCMATAFMGNKEPYFLYKQVTYQVLGW